MKRFSTAEEVIEMANKSEFGLMAGIFTKDLDRAAMMVDALESGTVCINSMMMVAAQTPFGGVKQSGYGSEGGYDSILAYTQVKTVFQRFVWALDYVLSLTDQHAALINCMASYAIDPDRTD